LFTPLIPPPFQRLALSTPQELSLTFNIPHGHQGPLIIKLDLASLLNGSAKSSWGLATPPESITSSTPCTNNELSSYRTNPPSKKRKLSKKVEYESRTEDKPLKPALGFLDLAAELRNMIYRLLFVVKDPFSFHNPTNFCRSGAFLSTCSQVYGEGRQILYSENSFYFEKQLQTRANYWNPSWTEVGWKDVRLFLECIGPENISLIREISILFEDASPSSSPHLDQEQRRFVNDGNLIQCLILLASFASLKTLALSFHGKRRLVGTDYRFLKHLKTIKADEVKMVKHTHYPTIHYKYMGGMVSNIQPDINTLLLRTMQRKEKLYKSE